MILAAVLISLTLSNSEGARTVVVETDYIVSITPVENSRLSRINLSDGNTLIVKETPDEILETYNNQ